MSVPNYKTLRKIFICLSIILVHTLSTKAQKNNHTSASLINADKNLQILIAKKGINNGFISASNDEAITFKPGPVNLKSYYKNSLPNTDIFTWQIASSTIAKSGDFGITKGPYIVSEKETAKLTYGNYFCVWHSKYKSNWEAILHVEIPCPKLSMVTNTKIFEPNDTKYSRLLGPKKIKMREDIVFSTDELLGKSLNLFGNKNLKEFYAPSLGLYLAGYQPINGAEQVLKFIKNNKITIQTSPTKTGRAYSGDLAYTIGTATLTIKKQKKTYSYLRIWQISPNMKWYIIVDAYLPL